MKEEGDEEKLHLALGEYSSKLKRNGPEAVARWLEDYRVSIQKKSSDLTQIMGHDELRDTFVRMHNFERHFHFVPMISRAFVCLHMLTPYGAVSGHRK